MKKILLLLFISFIYNTASFSEVRDIGDNYKLAYTVLDTDGNHVSGHSVSLKIQKMSNSQWYDFSDSSFKASGWTTLSTTLLEDTTGQFYYYNFDPPASETSAELYSFIINNSSTGYVDHQVVQVSYQNIGTSTFNNSSDQVIVVTNNDKTGYALSTTNQDSIVDKVWDELQSTHTTTGTLGSYLDAKVSESGTSISSTTIANAVWDASKSSHTLSGSTGKVLNDVETYTNGIKDNGTYNGIENMIRQQHSTQGN